MKKITFTVVILAFLLLFSGCDAMLEIFYPEFAEENNVTINISISASDILTLGYSNTKPLLVELYTSGENPDIASGGIATPIRSMPVFNEPEYTCYFFVPAGTYDIWIWQDTDGSGGLNSNDFILNANDPSPGAPSITFTGSEGTESYTANSWVKSTL